MSVDPRRTQPFCTPECYRECRCSRWPDYVNRFGWPVRPSGELEYYERVLATGPIAYWPLWETAGAVAQCLVNPLQNGTAVGVTWANDATGGFGTAAPYFDGANDYINIFTATFDAAFNGATGSVALWCRVANVGVWTDGLDRMAVKIFDDANNNYHIRKQAGNNTTRGYGEANAGFDNIDYTPFSSTDWFHAAVTWSDGANADEFKFFVGGAQRGATSAALNIWNGGGLDNANTVIGANTTVPALVFHGWLAHCAVWDYVLTPAEIAALATV